VVARLNAAVNKALAGNELSTALKAAGVEPQPTPPEHLAGTIAKDLAKWKAFTATHEIKLD
jgi:tripartite-type tricarboxylate transporter receptor subunit TctC